MEEDPEDRLKEVYAAVESKRDEIVERGWQFFQERSRAAVWNAFGQLWGLVTHRPFPPQPGAATDEAPTCLENPSTHQEKAKAQNAGSNDDDEEDVELCKVDDNDEDFDDAATFRSVRSAATSYSSSLALGQIVGPKIPPPSQNRILAGDDDSLAQVLHREELQKRGGAGAMPGIEDAAGLTHHNDNHQDGAVLRDSFVVTPPATAGPETKKNRQKQGTTTRSKRTVRTPRRFLENVNVDESSGVATTSPESQDESLTERRVEFTYGMDFFNHLQDDGDEEIPSRHLRGWRLFRKVATKAPAPGGRSAATLVPKSQLPDDDAMARYVLLGWLVAPDGTEARVRLDRLGTLYFDSYERRRGFWVSSVRNRTEHAYYRLLEPDDGTAARLPSDKELYLKHRALVAVISSIVEVCSPDEKNVMKDGEVKVVDLGLFVQRMKKEGIDVIPILSLFGEKLETYLQNHQLCLRDGQSRVMTVHDLPRSEIDPAALLNATVVAERVSGFLPWGMLRDCRKRQQHPAAEGAIGAKKQRAESDSIRERASAFPLINLVSSASETYSKSEIETEPAETPNSMEIEEKKSDTRSQQTVNQEARGIGDKSEPWTPQATSRKPADAEKNSKALSQQVVSVKSVNTVAHSETMSQQTLSPKSAGTEDNTETDSQTTSAGISRDNENQSERSAVHAARLNSADSESNSDTLSWNSTDTELYRIDRGRSQRLESVSAPRRRPQNGDVISVDAFKAMIPSSKLQEIERGRQVRDWEKSQEAHYGRMMPDAINRVFEFMELSQNDVFFDIGSGIGTLLLQAAYTIGCHSIGLELLEGRHAAALKLRDFVKTRVKTWYGKEARQVSVDFVKADVKTPEGAKEFSDAIHIVNMTEDGAFKAFLNNFEGVLGDRSPCAVDGTSLEHYVAGQFASWPVGSQLVTISPLFCLGTPLERAKEELKRLGLMSKGDASHASFFSVDEMTVGPQNEVASWSYEGGCVKDVVAYKYTRIEQAGVEWSAFRCLNRMCPVARSGEAISALKLDDNSLPLINTCSCGYQPRPRREARHRRT